jgi:hypothetical protein
MDVGSDKHRATVLLHSPHELILPGYPADENHKWGFRLVDGTD